MKNTHTCPKCESTKIVRVPGDRGQDHMVVGPLGVLTSIPVTRFVCCKCGYSEEWIESDGDLERVKERYGKS
jgi:predicted RNA-binding Zn-ribbon protein involved in translation (DUF1610 family)